MVDMQPAIAHDNNGVRIFGPHKDGSFSMSVNGGWVTAMFDSLESALSWSGHIAAAEELWSDLGKTFPLPIRSTPTDADTSRDAILAAFQRAYETLVTDGSKREYEQDRDRIHHAFDKVVAPPLSERDALRAAKEKAEAERDQSRADLAAAKAKAVEVMGPFAGFGDFLASETEGFSDDDELRVLTESGYLLYNFSVGVFRAARALVEEWK